MSLSDYLPTIFGGDNEQPSTEMLEDLFRERESSLDLTVVFELPQPNMVDEPTAVFPYTILDDGEVYGTGSKEFVIPDNGFADDDAPVTEFIGGTTDTAPADVGVGALYAVEGRQFEAELTDSGDVVPQIPDAPEQTEVEA